MIIPVTFLSCCSCCAWLFCRCRAILCIGTVASKFLLGAVGAAASKLQWRFSGEQFPFEIVLLSLWRRDWVLELQFLLPLRLILWCFAAQSVQIAVEWLHFLGAEAARVEITKRNQLNLFQFRIEEMWSEKRVEKCGKRWEELKKGGKNWKEVSRAKKICEEMRRVRRGEKRWEGVRRAEKSWAEVRRVERSWRGEERLTRGELGRKLSTGGKGREELTRVEKSWSEARSGEKRSGCVGNRDEKIWGISNSYTQTFPSLLWEQSFLLQTSAACLVLALLVTGVFQCLSYYPVFTTWGPLFALHKAIGRFTWTAFFSRTMRGESLAKVLQLCCPWLCRFVGG